MHYTRLNAGSASRLLAIRTGRKTIRDDVTVEVRTALAVFEKISRLGIKAGDDWVFDQMRANSGFDGYTVTLADQHATLTVNFHNTFHVDSDSHQALQSFVEHMERILHLPDDV